MLGLVIIAISIASIAIFISAFFDKNNNKNERISYIKNNYPKAFDAFCKKNRILFTSAESLNKAQKKLILNNEYSYWENEEKRIEEANKRSEEIRRKYKEIEKEYPNGLNIWLSKNKPQNSFGFITENHKEKAIKDIQFIKANEFAYNKYIVFSKWESEQEQFAKYCRDLRDSDLTGFGCYKYKPDFKILNTQLNPQNGKYIVWQFFPYSYCLEEDLDYSKFKYIVVNTKTINKHQIIRNEDNIEKIASFIKKLNQENNDISVLFRDTRNGWDNLYISTFFYDEIVEKLKPTIDASRIFNEIVDENEVFGVTEQEYDNLYNAWLKKIDKKVVIIDYATQNEELINFCTKIIEDSKDNNKTPLIVYISLMKGYSRDEMKEIIDKKNKEIEEEKRKLKEFLEIERIKKEKREKIERAANSWPMVKGVHHYFFYYYYPTKYDDVTELDWDIRNLIWDFKDGKRHDKVCELLVEKLKSIYAEALDMLTFVCIPASKRDVNEKRYKDFMKDVCESTGMKNGYEHITITKEKEPSHLGGESPAEYSYDAEFFNQSLVVLFDDVVTRGRSIASMKEDLENVGATVVAAISIGRTYSDWGGNLRQPHPYLAEQNAISLDDDDDDLPF